MCIIIEDDLVQQRIIENHIKCTKSLILIKSYESSIDAVNDLLYLDVDIIFLDIELPGMDGLEFLEKFKLGVKTKVILTTSNKDYALQAYDFGVVDYLLKPISYSRFLKAVNKIVIQSKNNLTNKEYLFIKSNGVTVKIDFRDILWIQSASEYVKIYTTKGKHMIYSSMNSILERLPSNFVRVHRSNIVAINKIEKIHNDIIEIDNEHIKISKGYKSNFNLKLNA